MMKGKGWLQKLKKILFSPAGTIGLFALAMILLLTSSVGGAQAALTFVSETYTSRIQMYDIGVSLLENGQRISWRDYGSREGEDGNRVADGTWEENTGRLLEHMLDNPEDPQGGKLPLQLGKVYEEKLNVRNSGMINQYVRVTIYKYWMIQETDKNGNVVYQKDEKGRELKDAEGNPIPSYKKMPRTQELSPDLIDLHLLYNECDGNADFKNGWLLDKEASTDERTVLYYQNLLYCEDEAGDGKPMESSLFADTLTIKGAVADKVEQKVTDTPNGKLIETVYKYDGVQFQIEVRVDAVQEHNAEDAAWSAWGRKIQVQDGVLSLAD